MGGEDGSLLCFCSFRGASREVRLGSISVGRFWPRRSAIELLDQEVACFRVLDLGA